LDESLKQQAGLAAAAFEQRIMAYRQTLEAVAVLSANNESRYALQDYLDSVVKTRPNWLDVQIVSADGNIVLSQSKPNSATASVSFIPLIREADRKNAFVVSTDQFSGENVSVLSVAQPVANGNFVVARIDGASVSDVFKDLHFPEDNIIAVFDEGNRLLYRSRVSPEQMSLDFGETPLQAALTERSEGTIEVESPYDHIARVYGLAEVKAANAVVIVGVPSSRLYEPARRQFAFQTLLGLIFLTLGAAAAYAIARSITRPMSVLSRAAQRFGAGDLTAHVDIEDDGTIGELASTFNQMAVQITDREVELKALDRLKSEFVSSVSHELRTPLTTIKTFARVLQSDNLSDDDRADYLETIAVECDRQINFVQSLLDLSRIESGAYRVSLSETDVVKVLSECVSAGSGTAEVRGVNLVLEQPANPIPPAISDESALCRVVTDIIDNSIKYSPPGGTVNISVGTTDDRIAIAISDDGCGIAESDIPHIFEKFFRGRPLPARPGAPDVATDLDDSGSFSFNEAPGVGLGLYLVSSLMVQIHGEIDVKSPVPGKDSGTLFTLSIPKASGAGKEL
jgi:signal transduction histidine kinase